MPNDVAGRVQYTLMELATIGESLERCLEHESDEVTRAQLFLAAGLIANLRKAWHREVVDRPSREQIRALMNVGEPLQRLIGFELDAVGWLTLTEALRRVAGALEEGVQPSVRGRRIGVRRPAFDQGWMPKQPHTSV